MPDNAFKREIAHELEIFAREYAVVTLTGPRKSGKTPLVKMVFPNKAYVDL